MPLNYRPACEDDLEHADALVVGSINELTERHAFGPMARTSPPNFQRFSLGDEPEGLWIAEEAGEILGFAFSWTNADFWFLAQLFVAPDQQGRGIGNELIRRTLTHAAKAQAANRALITFAFNKVSQGLYISHGLFPRLPLYMVSGERETVLQRLHDAPLRTVPIEPAAAHFRELGKIDLAALGFSREKHHRYLMQDSATAGFLLYEAEACVGYAYVAGGHVGPLAVIQPDTIEAAFTTALTLAAARSGSSVSAFLPGSCEGALRQTVRLGMRITFPMLLMSAHEFGDWTRYLPRNPGFM